MQKSLLARWRSNFLTGLAVVLPAAASIGILVWIFGTVSNITDLLLFFLPRKLTHEANGDGAMYWYWSLFALLLAVALITLAGLLTRYYLGKRLIAWMDNALLRVPLLNKVYGTIKQVNDAFTSGGANSFKTVVLVEFPHEGMHSVGFITSEQNEAIEKKTGEKVVCVFIPTTPNPTSGFMVIVPESKVTKLDMSVAEGIKYIISLGSVSPDAAPATTQPPARGTPGRSG
ncbi:MAG: DUF502 domain-containing protein [Verrucomicrobia bacterium]|nr:MAG: DUF502 domain-containing protein [Verrucomicrobiota bacterium]